MSKSIWHGADDRIAYIVPRSTAGNEWRPSYDWLYHVQPVAGMQTPDGRTGCSV